MPAQQEYKKKVSKSVDGHIGSMVPPRNLRLQVSFESKDVPTTNIGRARYRLEATTM